MSACAASISMRASTADASSPGGASTGRIRTSLPALASRRSRKPLGRLRAGKFQYCRESARAVPAPGAAFVGTPVMRKRRQRRQSFLVGAERLRFCEFGNERRTAHNRITQRRGTQCKPSGLSAGMRFGDFLECGNAFLNAVDFGGRQASRRISVEIAHAGAQCVTAFSAASARARASAAPAAFSSLRLVSAVSAMPSDFMALSAADSLSDTLGSAPWGRATAASILAMRSFNAAVKGKSVRTVSPLRVGNQPAEPERKQCSGRKRRTRAPRYQRLPKISSLQ